MEANRDIKGGKKSQRKIMAYRKDIVRCEKPEILRINVIDINM